MLSTYFFQLQWDAEQQYAKCTSERPQNKKRWLKTPLSWFKYKTESLFDTENPQRFSRKVDNTSRPSLHACPKHLKRQKYVFLTARIFPARSFSRYIGALRDRQHRLG